MGLGGIAMIAIGGALAFEGVLWAIFPSQTRRMYEEALSQMDDKALHIGGLVSVMLGVILVGAAVKLGG